MKRAGVWVGVVLWVGCLLAAGFLGVGAWLDVPTPRATQPEIIRLSLGHQEPRDGRVRQSLERFAKEVRRHSQGRLELAIVESKAGSGQEDLLFLSRQGIYDLVALPVSALGQQVAAFKLFDFPFYFSSPSSLHNMIDGEVGQRLLRQTQALDMMGLAFWEEGFRQLVTSRKADVPDEWKGMRFGVVPAGMSSPMFSGSAVKLVTGQPGPGGENVIAGTVDGWETVLTQGVLEQLRGGNSRVLLSNHAWQGVVLAMGWPSYRALPADLLEIIKTAAKDVGQWTRQQSSLEQQQMEKKFQEAGIAVEPYAEMVRNAWMRKARRLALAHEENLGVGLLAEIEESEVQRPGGDHAWIVGVDANFSDPSSHAGLAIKRGVQLACDEINDAGRIGDKPLRMVVTDNQGSASVAVGNVMRLGQKWGAVALVSGGSDAIVREQVAVTKNQKMILLVPYAASVRGVTVAQGDLDDKRHVFRLAADEYQKSQVFFDELLSIQGKVALMLENSVSGRSLRTLMTQMFWDHGKAKPMVVWFHAGQKIFLDPVQQMKKAGVTAFLLLAGPEETRRIRSTMGALSYQAQLFGFHGGDGVTPGNRMQGESPASSYSYIETFSLDLSRARTPAGDALRRRYWNLFASPESVSSHDPSLTAQAYDLVMLMGRAFMRSPDRSMEKMGIAMERLEAYRGAIKTYSWPFSPSRHEALSPADLIVVQSSTEGGVTPRRNVRQ
ncbi:MAG: TRAP transporter substrate-binding protein DctP [Magnetococcales bacterium]|nr:TRAP transporter substrate-binding protein DctP [Magnetococcales bacterium]